METKKCSSCGEEKALTEFHDKRGKKGGNSYCKPCLYAYQKKRWTDRKVKAVEYKGGSCSKCGYDKYIGALEFHHLDPTVKEFVWKELRQMSWDKVLNELDKCVMLCSNCHKEEHAGIE
jgi:5-methylcytosine-specific restriction endonuclease McrA